MAIEDYLNGSIYHMVHMENITSILQRRAILSKELMIQEGISYRSIAYENVQNLRDRIFIWDEATQKYRRLHSYVPFYFSIRTPMLYVQYQQGLQEAIIIFEVSRTILNDRGVLFTDGNASNQQLSKDKGEKVGIKPATPLQKECQRFYKPGGPFGTNSRRSHFFSDINFLDQLDWEIINSQWFNESEKKRVKHAEVLIPDLLPLRRVQNIFVSSQSMEQVINKLIMDSGLKGRIPWATCNPNLFF